MEIEKSRFKTRKPVRYFEYFDENSSEFWEVSIDENCVNVRCGNLGTAGQSTSKDLGDAAVAAEYAEKLAEERLAKGYVNAYVYDASRPAAQLAAAQKSKTSRAALDMLANSDSELVLLAVAANLAASSATRAIALKKLTGHDTFLRKRASDVLTPDAWLEVLARHQVDKVRLDVAKNRSASEGALAALAGDSSSVVRKAVGKNVSTPAPILAVLANDRDLSVVASVASNRATPKYVLESLLDHESSLVKDAAESKLEALEAKLGKQVLRSEKASQTAAALALPKVAKAVKGKPAEPRDKESNSDVIATPSEKIQNQIKKATELQQVVIAEIKSNFPHVLKPRMSGSAQRNLLSQIELAAESFKVIVQECRANEVNRTVSMLSGPFFTTKKHPIPTSKSEMLCPIVQLDLRTASFLSGEPIGDGLLQLWYDVNTCEGLVRVIPRPDVSMQDATEFRFLPARKFDGFPLPLFWNSDPLSDVFQIMSKFKSNGVSGQQEYGADYLSEINEEFEVADELFELVKKFEKLTDVPNTSIVTLFGTFYPIQYHAAEVGKRCLLSIGGDWGASGGAQVFYDIGKTGQTSFTFRDCLR